MAKEKKEKVVVRKCHYCKKPLDEGKDFCLHCGHTYTEEDPHAAEKKAKKKKKMIGLLIKLGILLGALAIIATVVLIIVHEVNKSDYLRITNFIRKNGEFVEGTGVEDEEESVEESSDGAEAEAGALSSVESTEESPDGESDDVSGTESESELVEEEERRMILPETFDRYVYYLNDSTYLSCGVDDKSKFYITYDDFIEGFQTLITIEINEETPNEYLWEATVSYESDNVIDAQYNITRSYHGFFDPADFSLNEGDVQIAIKEAIDEEAGDEGGDDTVTEDESSADTETETETEESEDEANTESGDDESEGEEGEEDAPPPLLDPEEYIRNAALEIVTMQVREMIYDLYECIEKNEIPASLDDLGFTKYQEYLDSLDPLKNMFNK